MGETFGLTTNVFARKEGDNTTLEIEARALTDADIPASITSDIEITATLTTHISEADPHPVYVTQSEGGYS